MPMMETPGPGQDRDLLMIEEDDAFSCRTDLTTVKASNVRRRVTVRKFRIRQVMRTVIAASRRIVSFRQPWLSLLL